MNKDEWLQKCADEYVRAAGMDAEEAKKWAAAAWDAALLDEGSDEAVIEERDPAEEVRIDMSYWEPG